MATQGASHAALMNTVYKRQRLIYDATRKYFLFGRDYLIQHLDAAPEARILEVACGTGRNLDLISRKYPKARLYGFDISSEMLVSARAKLGNKAELAEGDATDFTAKDLFGVDGFDRIILSYSISMIPDWQTALRQAVANLAPGGEVHVVDFGDQGELPGWFARMLRNWLAKFHVTPRGDFIEVMDRLATESGGTAECRFLFRRYAQYGVLKKA